ncbi:MAG: hypothetical protein HGA98_03130 [Deltaproteobacteria bacterium]|nr:hypothetical protein [Deltaproteobacteria bacterium]
MHIRRNRKTAFAGLLAGATLLVPVSRANAHCDSLDGPVVVTAKAALAKGDVTPILKWVGQADEGEIKAAFARTLVVRAKGPEAKELADRFFFETLVRVHRAGEGFPYTGLKATVAEAGPAVLGADKALETGSVEGLVKAVTDEAAAGLRRRFAHARELKEHANHNVAAGREYVAAYVDYVHYAEGLHEAAARKSEHHGEGGAKPHGGHSHAQ